MSLQALVDETLEQLNRTRELFGPAPRSATFAGTPGLESAHAAVTTQQDAVTENWHGESSAAYGDAVAPRVATLGRAIPADNTISALTASVAQTSGQGRRLMDGIIADTHSGIAALAPSTDTPAGRAQLVAHLQTQLDRAHALVDSATQQSSVLGSQISAAAADYHGGDQTQDQREDQRRKSGVQPVDYKTRPQDPPHWNDEDDDSGVSQPGGKKYADGHAGSGHHWGGGGSDVNGWAGPGYQTEAKGQVKSGGASGSAGFHTWAVKGGVGGETQLGPVKLGGNAGGELGVDTSVEGSATSHGGSVGGEAFGGLKLTGGEEATWGPVDEKLGIEGWAGAGASANAHADWDNGKLSLGANMGLAAGLGGKISPHITIDTKPITQAVERGFDSAAKWLESLF